jgi:hypothetical protein
VERTPVTSNNIEQVAASKRECLTGLELSLPHNLVKHLVPENNTIFLVFNKVTARPSKIRFVGSITQRLRFEGLVQLCREIFRFLSSRTILRTFVCYKKSSMR